ncbi:hypothetical protein [Fimbriiglobus ruber]|uniref:Uncharacterized protein n=1 Tax=Fimbriiglobus ruber TaxID=1908690 RepID=A0A225DK41_9BACT|nr:hypothetical protein [Fimbriiglobus ruber]OWK41821.1 hypothetical protein FRUB_03899 [Fimbriiglobus ruber]
MAVPPGGPYATASDPYVYDRVIVKYPSAGPVGPNLVAFPAAEIQTVAGIS